MRRTWQNFRVRHLALDSFVRLSTRLALFAAGLMLALPTRAEAPTLHWRLPLPADQAWRIVDLREGNGIRHEEYIPRGQGIEDYRDRIIVQRMVSQNLNPETYLAHVSAGLRAHCSELTTSGLFASERDGLPSAALTVYCSRFGSRSYGYVVAQKAVLDGNHLFVVEREWRLPAFSVDATCCSNGTAAGCNVADALLKPMTPLMVTCFFSTTTAPSPGSGQPSTSALPLIDSASNGHLSFASSMPS